MEPDLLCRAMDLAGRAEKYATPMHTAFLTLAEQAELCRLVKGERGQGTVLCLASKTENRPLSLEVS